MNTPNDPSRRSFLGYALWAPALSAAQPSTALANVEGDQPNSTLLKKIDSRTLLYRGRNENPLGCSDRVKKNLLDPHFSKYLHRYDLMLDSTEMLQKKIASYYGLKKEQLSIASGSKAVLCNLLAYLSTHDYKLILSNPEYNKVVRFSKNCRLSVIQDPISRESKKPHLERLASLAKGSKSAVYLSNPHFPYGHFFPKSDILQLAQSLAPNYLIVDEAYIQYTAEKHQSNTVITEIDKHPNLIVIRTFSKIFGLAGLRVGYMATSQHQLHRKAFDHKAMLSNAFGAIGALHAMEDDSWLKKSYLFNQQGIAKAQKICRDKKLEFTQTNANFFSILFDKNDPRLKMYQKKGFWITKSPKDHNYLLISAGEVKAVADYLNQLES